MRRIYLSIILVGMAIPLAYAQSQPLAGGEDQKFQGFNLQGYSDNGEKSWDVNGDTADIKGSEIKLSNVNANSYGNEKVNVTAQNGTINQTSGEMRLEKDVVMTSEKGTQLMTDSLDWNRQTDLVKTKDDVLITDDEKGMTVTGTGMEAHPGLKSAKIEEDVTVRVNTEPKDKDPKFVTITSDGPMTLDQAKSMAVFEDNVVAIQTDRTLKADRMEIYFDSEKNAIKEMICIGNVEIVQGENQTFADRATYKAAEQRLILSGRPKLIMQTENKNGLAAFGN